MRTWKKALSLPLALALALILLAPAASAAGEQKWWEIDDVIVWNANDLDGVVDEKTFNLQNWDFGQEGVGVWEPEVQSFSPYMVANLDLGMDLRTTASKLIVRAWSDPAGDGVYVQRLWRACDTPGQEFQEVIPVSEIGPLEYGNTLTSVVYTDEIAVCPGTNRLDVWGEGGKYMKITADYLTELFGPNTLIILASWNGVQYSHSCYLLTGETIDPARLNHEMETVSDCGGIVDQWAVELVNKAEKNFDLEEFAYQVDRMYLNNITRAQFAALTVKLYEAMSGQSAPAAGSSPFTDTGDPAVIQAQALGFVSGVGNNQFAPDASVTREQAASMLSRVYEKLGGTIPNVSKTTFADDGSVSNWARDAVAFMADKGIVSGTGNNNFSPKGNASIEQALVIALRMFENLK